MLLLGLVQAQGIAAPESMLQALGQRVQRVSRRKDFCPSPKLWLGAEFKA